MSLRARPIPKFYSLRVSQQEPFDDDIVSLSDAVYSSPPRYFDFELLLGEDVLLKLTAARVDYNHLTPEGPAALNDMIIRANGSILTEWAKS